MLSGAYATGQWLPIAVIILSTVLNAAYFLPIVFRAFQSEPARAHAVGAAVAEGTRHDGHGEAPFPMVLALTITATLTIVLFLLPDVPMSLARFMLEGGVR